MRLSSCVLKFSIPSSHSCTCNSCFRGVLQGPGARRAFVYLRTFIVRYPPHVTSFPREGEIRPRCPYT